MSATTAVRFRGRVLLDGSPLRCPGRGVGNVPHQLTLTASGSEVMATCGERTCRMKDATGRKAGCLWVVEGLTPAALAPLATAKAGRIRAQLPGGQLLEGKLNPPPAAGSGPGKRWGWAQ